MHKRGHHCQPIPDVELFTLVSEYLYDVSDMSHSDIWTEKTPVLIQIVNVSKTYFLFDYLIFFTDIC